MDYEASRQPPHENGDMDEDDVDEENDDASSNEDPRENRNLSMDEDDEDDDQDMENEAEEGGVQNVDDDDEDDDDAGDGEEEEVLAAVVVDDEEADDDEDEDDADEPTTEVIAEAAVVHSKPAPTKKSATAAAPKKRSASVSPPKSKKRQPSTSATAVASAKGKKRSRSLGDSNQARIPPDRLKAAQQARAILNSAIEAMPAIISETYIVRNMGHLYIEPTTEEPLFSTANALYPVGFSCDRYEFSPVHGRVLKLRCSILDGRKIRKKQLANGIPTTVSDGPVFRVMWGRGVDEDSDRVRYPYVMSQASKPVTVDKSGDAAEIPEVPNLEDRVPPVEGMRVKVRFDGNTFYTGTITDVGDSFFNKTQDLRSNIVIEYDDGHEETAVYPDPDIILLAPGMDDQTDAKGNVHLTQLNGAPVKCVVGRNALEVWGRLLVELGLIDENILDSSLNAVDASRKEGLAEAKGKMEALKLQRQQARARKSTSLTDDGEAESDMLSHGDAEGKTISDSGAKLDRHGDAKREMEVDVNATVHRTGDADATGHRIGTDDSRESRLRQRIDALREELTGLKEDDRSASIALADARIREIGPFLSNPFNDSDQSRSQQLSWLTTAVRKEKVKMGSTGNKKKIVNATDLLERNNTFFNPDIEALIEGLPGSEHCHSYVFRVLRTGGATAINRAWVHEAHLRQERERERNIKLTKEAKAKASQVKEREMKRKRRDEVRDARKRQKLEEEDLKKKARAEERLSRLSVQVDERLNKEASFQREKVIGLMVKNLSREFARRRKAAELLSGQAVAASKELQISSRSTPPALPPLGKIYDEEILRVWDFINSFGSSFLERGYVSALPTLESLQEAIDSLREPESTKGLVRSQVLGSLTDLAVALCKPLAPSLTRHLFASLIALNPVLQKDFGAAFFNEVNASSGAKTDSEGATPAILPVNSLTWQEIARLAFLADALGDLGLTKQESAHILRGYRSAGHPNSKEARRLRRSEDFYISLHRQKLSQGGLVPIPGSETAPHSVRVELPSVPTCYPGDYAFYLHNIKSLPVGSVAAIKDNLSKALDLLRSSNDEKEELKLELERINSTLAKVSLTDVLTSADLGICRKARNAVINLLDQATDKDGATVLTNGGSHKDSNGANSPAKETHVLHEFRRSRRDRMGLLGTLSFSEQNYKESVREREEYMTEALRLKEEMERKEKKDEEEDDDDDEEEEEERPPPSGKNSPAPSEATSKKKGESKKRAIEKVDERKESEETPQEPLDAVATVVENGTAAIAAGLDSRRIGKPTEYDDFCADIPDSPELVRRCLAVLRTLCGTNAAEPFIYPVDPQTNPGYYDVLVRPMCLREVGVKLQRAANSHSQVAGPEQSSEPHEAVDLEFVVKEFGRNVRLIGKNALSYGNAGPTVVSAAGEMLRIFERLLLEWVLAPEQSLTPLDQLDDERCVEQHPTDDESMVLLCDGCEGKYNMSRLNPPLHEVPNGDWYCPRCLSGRWWGDMDPRIGKVVLRKSITNGESPSPSKGVVQRCLVSFPEQGKSSLVYEIRFEPGTVETWTLQEVDDALATSGDAVPPVRCLEAVTECPGYGLGIDRGLRTEIVPIALNPNTSDAAAQVALGSAAFRDTISAAGTLLLVNPEDMTSAEWSRLLVLLIMKCSSSAVMQSLASKMENDANEKMLAAASSVEKISDIADVFPDFGDDDDMAHDMEKKETISGATDDNEGAKSGDQEVGVQQNGEPATVVVEATAVEVVEVKDVSTVTAVAENAVDGAAEIDAERKSKRSAAQIEKERRQRAREDCIAALCIKKQVRSTVASFEVDNVSHVVDAMLSTKDPGLGLSAIRCRGVVCAFCGLNDSDLGAPLVRVPDAQEWKDLIPHGCRSRRTALVADLVVEHVVDRNLPWSGSNPTRKLVTLKIRIDDELVSVNDDDEYFENIVDGGMLEFLPRNEVGFQCELQFRSDSNLPFVGGSLSAHECCAVAVHNSRKVQIVGEYKERRADLAEREFGLMCGRSLEIGKDRIGRSFWRFRADSTSLFIDPAGSTSDGDLTEGRWHRFADAASIASVIVSLGKDPIARELRRNFPEADRMIKKKTWSNELLKKRFPGVAALVSQLSRSDDAPDKGEDVKTDGVVKSAEEEEEDDEYDVRDEVLVESKSGKLLWDATILEVARSEEKDRAHGYRVHYKGWSSRFDEWVEAKRVVEPNDNNRHVQEELLEDRALCRDFVPPALENMAAKSYLRANDRARGSAPLPDFMSLLNLQAGSASDDVALATMKAAILMIEAALPVGSVDTSPKGVWNSDFASQWRLMVQQAQGPESLIRCVILLEDIILEDWMNPQVAHLRSCLPSRWKAVGEASPSSLAIRVFLLDQGITYAVVDKRKQR